MKEMKVRDEWIVWRQFEKRQKKEDTQEVINFAKNGKQRNIFST